MRRFLTKNHSQPQNVPAEKLSEYDSGTRYMSQAAPATPGLFRPENGGTVNFFVVNLMPQLRPADINRVFSAIKIYTERDFKPVWGITASFTILPFGVYPSSQQILGNSVIYLADKVINGSVNFGGAIAIHMMTAASPNDTISGDGPQPGTMISGVPNIPVGTPYTIVPYGDKTYGLAAVASTNVPILNVLGIAASHEIFEIIKDPWPAGLGASYQSVINNEQAEFYIKEICDPTEYGPQLTVDGISVTNFCYPDYFNPYAAPGTKLDNAFLIKTPLTPYAGMQFGLLVDGVKGGMVMFVDVSKTENPDVVTRYVAAKIYTPCSTSKPRKIDGKGVKTGKIDRSAIKNELHLMRTIARPTREDFLADSGTRNLLDLSCMINSSSI